MLGDISKPLYRLPGLLVGNEIVVCEGGERCRSRKMRIVLIQLLPRWIERYAGLCRPAKQTAAATVAKSFDLRITKVPNVANFGNSYAEEWLYFGGTKA